MPYKQYAGSPDIFDEKGVYQPTVDWTTNPQIEKIGTPRPDIKTEANFADVAGTNIVPSQLLPAESLKTIGEPVDSVDYASVVAGAMPPEPTKLELDQAAKEAEVKQTSTDIMSLLSENQGKGAFEAEQMAKIGADQQEKEIQDITNQMKSLQMESQAQQLKAENQDKEMVIGAVRGQQAAIQRDTAIKTLMLSAQLQTKQNNYSLALNQVQRAVDLKYAPIENRIKILKEQYLMNRDELERIDKKRADATALTIKKQELLAQDKKQNEKDVNAISLEAAKNGAPQSIISAIGNSKSLSDAINYASGFLSNDLENKLKQAQIDKINEDVRSGKLVELSEGQMLYDTTTGQMIKNPKTSVSGGTGGSGGGAGSEGSPTPAVDDPGYMLSVIRNSKGGKAMDASSISSLQKSYNVLNQLGDLTQYITGEATGPILGILRSNNPYDVKAQLIKAQLTAIVPNLARGVYGEVGVLTDNDVALYSRTLPNLNSTEELRKAVLGMTIKTVQRSMENQFEIQAGGGRDVSGYANLYTKIKDQADKLNSDLGIDNNTTVVDADVVQTFTEVSGSDGYVSPNDWKAVKEMFGNDALFEKTYSKFKNPKDNYQ